MIIVNSITDRLNREAAQVILRRGGGEFLVHLSVRDGCLKCGASETTPVMLEVPENDSRFRANGRDVVACAVGLCARCAGRGSNTAVQALRVEFSKRIGFVDCLGHSVKLR